MLSPTTLRKIYLRLYHMPRYLYVAIAQRVTPTNIPRVIADSLFARVESITIVCHGVAITIVVELLKRRRGVATSDSVHRSSPIRMSI